mgnify:CR=1 FL=1
MSIKKLFDKENPYKILSAETLDSLGSVAESSGNINQRLKEKNRFIPIVNFEYPENFARYGKATKYYEDAIIRIYDDYPYDGSLSERAEYRNESSYLDLYILDQKYPRRTGHAIFSPNGWGTVAASLPMASGYIALSSNPEYVKVLGGPNQAPAEYLNKPLHTQFEKANIYAPDQNRQSNLKFDLNEGVTVEFWMNKPILMNTSSYPSAGTSLEIPFMLSNNDSGSLVVGMNTGDTTPTGTPFTCLLISGSIVRSLNYSSITNADYLNNGWHHFAFSFKNSADGLNLVSSLYLDGKQKEVLTVAASIGEVTGALNATIGAGTISKSTVFPLPTEGYGKLSGSIDEFRFWKTERTAEQIGKYWFTQYGGGTNTTDSNVDLGVYYKFNEGIMANLAIDANVLDYSGRISNGQWTGYSPQSRLTSSAIDIYLGKASEFTDPIIYPTHPAVISLKEELLESGSAYDLTNNASIYNSIPSWITEEDELGSKDLENLTQIMASYFDTLQLQLESLPKLKDKTYNDPSLVKPHTFSSRLLESQGFVAPEIFADADVMAQILNRDADRKFELDLYDIKNVIYQNVYNNLTRIYKSKGTEKSFRNLIRCFGVDEDLVRLNIYGNNVEYELRDNYRTTAEKKKYADFNHPDRFSATVYQQTGSSNPNSVSFITGSAEGTYLPFTIEAEAIFPKKLEKDNINYFPTPFLSSSLFGFHGAPSATDLTWPPLISDANLQVYAVREEIESPNLYFKLVDRNNTVNITTPIYDDAYDNQKWNLAIKFRPEKSTANRVSGSGAPSSNWVVEFYGVNSDAGIVNNEFLFTASMNGPLLAESNKRLYIGAHRTNFTGSTLHNSDAKISSLRYWASYLTDDAIKTHSRDPSNHGSPHPYQSSYLYPTSMNGITVPQVETLALNWDFSLVTSSDGGVSGIPTISDAGYLVNDISSGSVALTSRYGWLGKVIYPQHTGRGDFYIPRDTKVADTKFIYSGKTVGPEVIQSSDMINILGESDLYFDREARPVNFFYSIEKSMYQTISDEMLKMFSTIKDFSNLIGDPVNRYRPNYKAMEKLRSLFFENVENTPNLDKYVEFYKWIDGSLNAMLQQLVPMSADVSDEIRTMVESHVLERNKYQSKFPSLEFTPTDPIAGIQGINKLLINWKFDHHPLNNKQNTHCRWWKTLAHRNNPVISSGNTAVDAGRQKILDVTLSALNRRYTTPLRLDISPTKVLHGGNNVKNTKGIDIVRAQMKFGTNQGMQAGPYDPLSDCMDVLDPSKKAFVSLPVNSDPNAEYLNTYAKIGIPWTIKSSSVPQIGYQASLGRGTAVENIHRDIYGPDAEVPMQGPFTNANVGGLPFRHAPLNKGDDNSTNRMEGWNLVFGSPSTFESRSPAQPRGPYYRDETAKRPVNIRNIRGDYGNYTKTHQVVQTAGRFMNNKAWVSASGWDLQPVGIPSYWVAGLMDTPKIQRGRHESIMVSRFNAPGGPDTMGDSNGGAGLDRLSAEYSFNNDLNSRNWNVRSAYYPFLTSHVNQFGYFSNFGDLINAGSSSVNPTNYAGTGSIYQVNRNTLRRMEMSGTNVITGSQRDNFWVQHAIPRSDLQYSWVNASYESADPSGFGYWHASQFEYTGIESPVLTETFSGTLGAIWSAVGTTQRQSKDSTNWLVRFGQQVGSSSLYVPRKLELQQDVELPFSLTYDYAQGQYENRGSRVYSSFGVGRTVLSSSGKFVDTFDKTRTTDRFSLSCWFKPVNLTTNQNLFTWDDATSPTARARLYVTANNIRFVQNYTPGPAVLDARWVHAATASWTNIVITHDVLAPTVGASNYPTLYINGVSASLDHAASSNGALGATNPDTFDSFIMAGRDPNNPVYPDNCYTGSLDNVIWYNELFDPSHVTEIYNNGFPKSPSNHSFYQPNSAVNDPNHYWQLGDANKDKPLIVDTAGAPWGETEGAVYDWNALGNPYESTFWAITTPPFVGPDFQMIEYDGYNMQQPADGSDEGLSLQISYDGGTNWETASVISPNGDYQGKDSGLITRVTNFYSASPGQTGRIRFYQPSFSVSKKDNWAIDNIRITRTNIIEPVTFSPYGDFSSRYYSLGPNLKYGNTNELIATSVNLEVFVPTVYVDLNYNVYEPLDMHNQSYGYPLPTLTSESARANYHPDEYLNTILVPDGFANNGGTQHLSKATLLNSILIKRNGPYGYPTWKQIRTGDHAIARSMRKNNLIGCTETPGKRIDLNGQQYIEKYGKTTLCKEPPVNSSYSTLDYLLGLRVQAEQEGKNPEFIVRPVHIKTTYGNNLSYFTSEKLNVCADYDKTGVSSEAQAYDTIKALYLDGALNDPSSPVYNLVSLKYAEKVYPAAINSYSGINRERTDYLETFWKTYRSPRNSLGALKFGGFNSQGLIRSQSAWALDACTQFGQPGPTSAAEMEAGVGLGSHYAVNYASGSSGELQNDYTFFWTRSLLVAAGTDSGSLKPSPIYNRKQDIGSIYSVVGASGMQTVNTYITSTAYLTPYELAPPPYVILYYPLGAVQTMGGNAKWEAGPLAGTIQNNSFVTGASSPFQNDYAAYNAEMILKNKEMSIIPEFRISEHMPYYFNEKGGDFLSANTASFTIPGTSLKAGIDNFYKTYSYSDFMKFFEVIDDDHAELDDLEKTLTLKCSALKKFLPYDGFYPAERTLEITSLFSSSYSQYISASGDHSITSGPAKVRPLYATLFSPGVLYNTIKSGIAVDYPAYTGSFKRIQARYEDGVAVGTYQTPYIMMGTGSRGTAGWDTRVSFENLLEPEQLNDITFVDMETNANTQIASSGTRSNLTASLRAPAQQNLYKLAINNFTAETSDFFLRNGLTTIKSDVSDVGYTFQSGTYSMRFKMYRSMNRERKSPKVWPITVDWYQDSGSHETITMYSRPTAFGPPVAGSDRIFAPAAMTSSLGGGWRQQTSDSLFGKNPSFTPPYYDGESWCDIILDVPKATVMTLDDVFISASVWANRIPKIAEAWPNNPPINVSEEACPMNRKWANNFAMQITSSVNLFRKEFTPSKTSKSEESARWVIQTKFETPILNFGDQTVRPLSLNNITLPSTGTSPYYIFDFPITTTGSAYYGYGGQTSTPIGMWHQFGLIPQKEEGIYISLDDVPDVWVGNVGDPSNASGGRYPPSVTTNRTLYSLADAVGFRKGVVRKLGKLSEAKTVSEGIVAIPYIIKKGERKFFQIDKGMIQYSEEKIANAQQMSSESIPAGDSIIDMVRKMKKFIIPPQLDFVKNSSVTPFAMYIFEFNHTFDQDDLSYMWQNLMPKTGTRFEEATAKISHKIMDTELLEKFKDRIRWMVFKVKQRGNNNYQSILAGGNEETKTQIDYSYNWPYDYFSLIEFAQIDSQIEYSTDKAIDINESFSDVSKEMQKGLRATKELTPSVESNREDTARQSKKEQNTRQKEIKSNNRKRRKNRGAFKTKGGDES